MFIKNLSDFAEQVGIKADDQPNIVIADADGNILSAFKGALSPELLAEVIAATGEG